MLINFFKNKRSSPTQSGGFTLVEMIVAMGLFAIVMFIATGALLSLISLNRKAQAQQVAINNINFVMESITRNIRVGTDYHCEQSVGDAGSGNYTTVQDCANGGDILAFQPPVRLDVVGSPVPPLQVYKFIKLGSSSVQNAIGVCRVDAGNLCLVDSDFSPLTAPEITIDLFKFYLIGTTKPSQPYMRAVVSGHAISNEINSPQRVNFYIQSGGSQRVLNI